MRIRYFLLWIFIMFNLIGGLFLGIKTTLEIAILIVLTLIAIFASLNMKNGSGWKSLSIFFLLAIINNIYLFTQIRSGLLITILCLNAVGFLISAISIRNSSEEQDESVKKDFEIEQELPKEGEKLKVEAYGEKKPVKKKSTKKKTAEKKSKKIKKKSKK